MELGRCIRVVAPAAAFVLAAAMAPPPMPASAAADPPAGGLGNCAAGGSRAMAGKTVTAAWYRLDPVLDAAGTLAGERLAAGIAGGPTVTVTLPPESFATGPVGARLLVGDDDGSRSRLRLLDLARACWTEVARESAVVRSAIMDPSGTLAFEHRVDRVSRSDAGVWRRQLPGGTAVRVLDSVAADTAYGPTFTTDLMLAADGRLVATACGSRACRSRVLDPARGTVTPVGPTGPVIGLAGERLVAMDTCSALPCPIETIGLADGTHTRVVEAAIAAAVGGPGDTMLVHALPDGTLATTDLAAGARSASPPVGVPLGALPVRVSSGASSGASGGATSIVLAAGGRLDSGGAASFLNPANGHVSRLPEVAP